MASRTSQTSGNKHTQGTGLLGRTSRVPKAPATDAQVHKLNLSILQAMEDDDFYGRFFKDDTWDAWKTFLSSTFGHGAYNVDIFKKHTQRAIAPVERAREAWLVCGRRAGKSRIVSLIAVYLACFVNYDGLFGPGEFGTLPVIGADRRGARVLFRYIRALIRAVPLLEQMVVGETKESIELSNDVVIEVHTANFRAVRGYTLIGALCVAGDTLVETEHGPREIRSIAEGDRIYTRDGLRTVMASRMTSRSAEVYEVRFSNGRRLVATGDHPVRTLQKGFVAVRSLHKGDEIHEWPQTRASLAVSRSIGEASAASPAHRAFAKQDVGKGYPSRMGLGSSDGEASAGISHGTDTTAIEGDNCSTERRTWPITGPSRPATPWSSIIATARGGIARLATSLASLLPRTPWSTARRAGRPGARVTHDTQSGCAPCGPTDSQSRGSAPSAATPSSRPGCGRGTVVLGVDKLQERIPVYNLSVAGNPEYFANGVLVHNCDEIAFWRDESSANPDKEIINALRPGMATIPSAMLLALSSPHGQRGIMFDTHERHFGVQESPLLVWQAASKDMNPRLPQHVIDEAYEDDPQSASAEYGANFRTDVEIFISPDVVKASTVPGRGELPPLDKHKYVAFIDPSGGTSDSFAAAIAHREGDRLLLDHCREWTAPFKPSVVIAEVAEWLKGYKIRYVKGDRYAAEFNVEAFEKEGITYEKSELAKSDLYLAVLPEFNSGRVEFLDDKRLRNQLLALERRVGAGGRVTVDHPPRAHDDKINAAAGALALLKGDQRKSPVWGR